MKLMEDLVVREGIYALIRTTLNIGVSVADAFPGVGGVISVLADAGKMFKPTDLTPDVSKKIAWGTEGFELLSLGFMPTHSIETLLQLRKDVPRMVAAWKRLQTLKSGGE